MGVELFGDWERVRHLLEAQPGARLALALRQATVKAAILLVREIQRGIRSQAPGGQPFVPLAASTVARKHSSKALIDTGFLINAITQRILQDQAFVGLLKTTVYRDGESVANIGAVMEYGATIPLPNGVTIIIPARPFLHPVMAQHKEAILDLYRDAVKTALLQ
ncbi:MAG TPA: phage virion morphogenesis protein [Armatimonadota bacterium]